MQMRPDIQITCMTKALRDVVIPAVDPTNKLAVEQANLVVAMLGLMARQLPLQFKFDRDELQRLTCCAGRLSTISVADEKSTVAIRTYVQGCSDATELLDRCSADPAQLLEQIKQLRRNLGAVVDAVAETSDALAQQQVESLVLEMSGAQLLRDRALMVSQGFESDPAALPHLDSLLNGYVPQS